MCDKSVDIYHSKIKFFLNTIRLKHCPDKDITQIMCDEGVDDSLATSKFTPDWFVTSKMIKKLYNAFDANENILYFNEDSANVTFCYEEMGILNINLHHSNLYNNFDKDYRDTIILDRLLTWHIKFKNKNHLKKKSEEVMPIVWHPQDCEIFECQKMRKNK